MNGEERRDREGERQRGACCDQPGFDFLIVIFNCCSYVSLPSSDFNKHRGSIILCMDKKKKKQ